jgi:hypothetical protein
VSENRQQSNRQPCNGAGTRNGHPHAQTATGRGPDQFVAHRARIAKQPRQAAEIDRDGSRPVHLDSRRELARDLDQRLRCAAFRGIKSAEHGSPQGGGRYRDFPIDPSSW